MPIIGSRADVYEGRADRTAGGLTKADIICRVMAGKKLYISQRVSTRMREVMKTRVKKPILKTLFPTLTENSNDKTKKNVRFNLEQNEIKQFRYDELDGQDIEQLQREMEEEDNEHDDTDSTKQPREFTIQELDDNQLDADIKKLF